ncbi:uncharacterized protein N7482_003557 [Penicillium canariense]|uniref:J domain-containing protein n=1 Tax=Penicillium canariense TaxID=189055 RepID=A0A9W9LPQ1_9EURO|nr:uncharacterized protein N7482_003557 [Penicillium canariense]KAJ5167963.1 hypothetical protein N7482_003557 [Penicillium canariense]
MFKKTHLRCCGGIRLLSSSATASPPTRVSFSTPGQGLWTSRSGRGYATVSGLPKHEYSWPSTSSFTPYEVLNLHRNAPYSKTRYYDLVKIYHPDRPCDEHPLCRNITPEIRLQRYRIVVTAHEILSDPTRRAAYDQTGAGWSHQPKRYNTVADASAEWGPYGPTIYANATWEDWERWNNRHQGKQQHVVDQRTFVRLVILLVLFGGAVQASWIKQLNSGYEQRLREVSDDSMRFLTGRRQQTISQMPHNDSRVQSFLIRRDPSGSGLKEDEEPVYQKELHPRGEVSDVDRARDGLDSPSETGIARTRHAERSEDHQPAS